MLRDTTCCNWLVEPFSKGTAFDIAHFGAQKDFSKYFFWELICFEFCEIGTKFPFLHSGRSMSAMKKAPHDAVELIAFFFTHSDC